MQQVGIAIVGGGLSGLYAAWRLEQTGLGDYLLLEARDVLGGRIASTPAAGMGRFDLGPAWFWPALQPQLDRLIGELGLERFPQHADGDMLAERLPGEPPLLLRGYANSPAAMRLAGGMEALTDALRQRLAGARILSGHTVRRLRADASGVEIDAEHAAGRTTRWRAGHVLLATPPRLAERSIAFDPALPQDLARQWRATATWMAPHAKYLAVYETPFWRAKGLSGGARSALGPLGEIHDASTPDGIGALFGFFGVSAQARRRLGDDALRLQCRTQLARLFGPQAAAPTADFIKDWAAERHTATAADLEGIDQHAAPPASMAGEGPWAGRLTGIGSEWSQPFPGYLAGAIDAAERALQALA